MPQHAPSRGPLEPRHRCPRLLRSWLSFHHVWYSVDLPQGQEPTPGPKTAEGEKEAEPRLYLLSVRPDSLLPTALAAAALIRWHVLTELCRASIKLYSVEPRWRC